MRISPPSLEVIFSRLHAAIDRLEPYRARLAGAVRKHPRAAAGLDAIERVWMTLVESFCAMIDPLIARYFPDMRLVAVVTVSGDIELQKIVKGTATSLGPMAGIAEAEKSGIAQSKWTSIELRLRSDQLLQRNLTLPSSSRDFLAPIIEHRLERLTPWRPERVLYGYRLLDESEPGGGINVALTATSKDFVTAPLQALGDLGLTPTAIGAQDEPLSEPLRVDLLRGAVKGARIDSRRMVSRIALASFAFLFVAYVGASFWASSAADAQREAGARLLKARRLLKSASMGAVGDRERALLEVKQPDKSMVVLIDRLAKAIPEDTYLKELAVTPDKVRLAGISANAPALVGQIESTGLFNVRFASAVTREKDQKDSFEVTADRTPPSVANTQ